MPMPPARAAAVDHRPSIPRSLARAALFTAHARPDGRSCTTVKTTSMPIPPAPAAAALIGQQKPRRLRLFAEAKTNAKPSFTISRSLRICEASKAAFKRLTPLHAAAFRRHLQPYPFRYPACGRDALPILLYSRQGAPWLAPPPWAHLGLFSSHCVLEHVLL